MKVTLIEPKSKRPNVYHYVKLPLLGLPTLGSILKERGHEVEIYNEGYSPIDLREIKADIVGISALTPTALRGYEILDFFRGRGVRTMIGGPHATFMPQEALEHADYVCVGEGENSVIDIVEGNVEKGIVGKREVEYEKTPIPDLSLIVNRPRKKGILSKIVNTSTYPIATSRGCPYDCSFCSVTKMYGRNYRMLSLERVLEEVDNSREKNFFFYDDNFAKNKKRAAQLFEELKKRKIKWSAQVDVHIADDEYFLSLMKESGCNYLYIGFESVNDRVLESYGKHQDRGDIEKCAKRLHKHNIRKHGMFVFGSDEDKPETVEDTVRFCRKNNIESVQFLVLTPLPGTKNYQELGDRVVIKDWNLYDGHHAVFSPKNFTREQLQELAIKGMEKFYSWSRDLKMFVKGTYNSLMAVNYADVAGNAKNTFYNFVNSVAARKILKKWDGC